MQRPIEKSKAGYQVKHITSAIINGSRTPIVPERRGLLGSGVGCGTQTMYPKGYLAQAHSSIFPDKLSV